MNTYAKTILRHDSNLYSCLKWCFCFFVRGSWQRNKSNATLLKLLPKSSNNIKEFDANKNSSFSPGGMESPETNLEYLSKSLRIFLNNLFVGKKKSVLFGFIGQAITQQLRPKALIVSLQPGLGILMHQHFGSRFLIESLNKHGFCVPYSKILRYDRYAAVHHGTKIPGISEYSSVEPTQIMWHVADKANHRSRTLHGRNIFYGVGIIRSVTPAVSSFAIPHLDHFRLNVSTEDHFRLTGI